jgi:glucosamine--fructose-6-phosphate aminotransferase (isomerizing)
MCGIVGYIGSREVAPILIKGLQRLEYRGYDSAGIALLDGGLKVYKKAGKVSDLVQFIKDKPQQGNMGIGHTRWATHGEPNDRNAHPHFSEKQTLTIIHNGIIENYAPLKEELKKRGHHFNSDTDTEVLIHLIEDIQENERLTLEEAIRVALNEVVGAYAIVIISKNHPDQLFMARKGSPLVIGIGVNEFFVASDASPIIEYTKNVVYLNDG